MDIIVWRRRIWAHDSPLYLEALWSPTHPATVDIRGVKHDMNLTHLQSIKDAITLLTGVRGVGRRQGTRYWSKEEFHAAWPKKVAEARRHRDGPVRQKDLARAYGISQPTLTRYLREYGHPTS
jgi:hypothetical protein